MNRNIKKFFVLITILSFIISSLLITKEVHAAAPTVAPIVLFTDGFEGGNTKSGGWTNSRCDIQKNVKYAGSRAARFNSSDSLTKSFSTSDYKSIQIQYTRTTKSCESNDHFIVDWYNGSSWTIIEDVTGNSGWTTKTWKLPSSAQNNPSFRIRFRTSHNGTRDYAYLDEVKVTGTKIIDTEPPTAPAELTIVSVTDTSVSLNWSASKDNIGVKGYYVYRDGAKIGTSSSINYEDRKLTEGTTYTYKVKAFDAAGNVSESSNIIDATTSNTPEPKVLFADGYESGNMNSGGWTNSGCDIQTSVRYAGSRAARFSSSDSLVKSFSTSGYESIQVQYTRTTRSCESNDHFIVDWYNGSRWTTIEDVTGNSGWTIKTWELPVSAKNNPSFKIRFRTSHNGSRDYAYLDEVKIIGTKIIKDTVPPTAPTGLRASSITESRITLDWVAATDNIGVTSYDVFRDNVKVGSSTTTSYSDVGLAQGTTYSYVVRALDKAGNTSKDSNTISATTKDIQAPTAPTNLSVSSVTDTAVSLNWSASSDNVGVTRYDIYRGSSKVGSSTTTSYTDTGLTQVTSYSYVVKAVDKAGNTSKDSNTVTATTEAAQVPTIPPQDPQVPTVPIQDPQPPIVPTKDTQAPTAPANLSASLTNGTSVSLSWSVS